MTSVDTDLTAMDELEGIILVTNELDLRRIIFENLTFSPNGVDYIATYLQDALFISVPNPMEYDFMIGMMLLMFFNNLDLGVTNTANN